MIIYGRTKEIKKISSKNKLGKVLSVGCGDGYTTSWVKNLVGVDINKSSIEFAKEHYPQHKFLISNAEKLPFKDGSFDTILAMDVIEYTNERKSLKEFARVLKKGGKIFISVPNKNLVYKLSDWSYWLKSRGGYIESNYYNENDIKILVEKSGFKVEKIYSRGIFFTPLHRILAIPFEFVDRFILGVKGRLGPLGTAIRIPFIHLVNAEHYLPVSIGNVIFVIATKERC